MSSPKLLVRGEAKPFVPEEKPHAAIYVGEALDWLRELPDESVSCVVTSPPYYGARDYGIDGQIGLEEQVEAYVANLVRVFDEVWRVLRRDGTLWLNLGDLYVCVRGVGGKGDEHGQKAKTHLLTPTNTGLKRKDMAGIPWKVAFALQRQGWYLRCDVIWEKTDAMPSPAKDRPTKSHEYVFMFTKSQVNYFDQDAVREAPRSARTPNPSGRNVRSVWGFPTAKTPVEHFAAFPVELPARCVRASCPPGGTVLDPFLGTGTTVVAALTFGRSAIGIELNPQYASMSRQRLAASGYPVKLIARGMEGTADASTGG
jgi:DNA modification methylase